MMPLDVSFFLRSSYSFPCFLRDSLISLSFCLFNYYDQCWIETTTIELLYTTHTYFLCPSCNLPRCTYLLDIHQCKERVCAGISTVCSVCAMRQKQVVCREIQEGVSQGTWVIDRYRRSPDCDHRLLVLPDFRFPEKRCFG